MNANFKNKIDNKINILRLLSIEMVQHAGGTSRYAFRMRTYDVCIMVYYYEGNIIQKIQTG